MRYVHFQNNFSIYPSTFDKYLYYLCSSMYSKLSNSCRCFHISYNTWFSHGSHCHALKSVFTNNYHIIMLILMKWLYAYCSYLNENLEKGCKPKSIYTIYLFNYSSFQDLEKSTHTSNACFQTKDTPQITAFKIITFILHTDICLFPHERL